MPSQRTTTIYLTLLAIFHLPHHCQASSGSLTLDSVLSALDHSGFRGPVHPHGSHDYERFRFVEIGNCNVLYPLVVVRPGDTHDVAAAVRAARSAGIDISVRSGGHGYNCNSLKNGSLHIDLRRLNKIQKVKGSYGNVSGLQRKILNADFYGIHFPFFSYFTK